MCECARIGDDCNERVGEREILKKLQLRIEKERKSVNAFHLFFVCPNLERIRLHAILHLNWKLKSQMKPYKMGPMA